MSSQSPSLPVVRGQNLHWIVAIILMFLGLAGTLKAAHLIFPREGKIQNESTPLPLETVDRKPATVPVTPVASALVAEDPMECVPDFSVLFGSGQAVGNVDATQVQQLVRWLNRHPDASLLIRGYSDSAGDEYSNMALSYRRAEFVKSVLLKAGLKNKSISVQAFGEYSPLVVAGESAPNQRRVSLTVPDFPSCRTKEKP